MQKHNHQQTLKKIFPENLVPMDLFSDNFPIQIDLAYARSDNLLLREAVYHQRAQLWCHIDLAKIVLLAAQICYEKTGYHFVLFDGLRTVDAQSLMLQTRRVRDNPHWYKETPRLLSPPGAGAHPRAMAIDLSLCENDGTLIDMGTDFDFLSEDPSPAVNVAHRNHSNLPPDVQKHRAILDNSMIEAAKRLGSSLFLLPQEWWDFRLPNEVYTCYAPLSDIDLPPFMRITLGTQYETNLPEKYTTIKNQMMYDLATLG